DRQAAVGLGHDLTDLRLDRRVLDRGGAVDTLDDRVGFLKPPVDVALADLAPIHPDVVRRALDDSMAVDTGLEARLDRAEERVPVSPRMDLRGVLVERLADIEQGGSLVEADLDRVHRGGGEFLALGSDDRDWLALVDHFFLSPQRAVRRESQ